MKYNFVYLGSDWDLYKIIYSDIQKLPNAIYIPGNFPPSNSLKGILYRIHFNKNINRIIPLPGKKIWNRTYFHNSFSTDNPICFIFSGRWLEFQECEIEDYLRKKYPNSKIVLFLTDIVSKLKLIRFSNRPVDINVLKHKYDLILSYDKGDCEKYGFTYHHTIFSEIDMDENVKPQYDVFFLGRSKGRIKDILKMYEVLRDHGLKCNFHITGVPEEQQKYSEEIVYNKPMSYIDNLKNVTQSKCLLEIMQEGADGFSIRTNEAICLNKFLITNNEAIKHAPFYRSDYIEVFESSNFHIDESFVNRLRINDRIDYHYKDYFSPIKLLEFIDKKL